MMYFLVLQTTYKTLQIGLAQEGTIIATQEIDSKHSSQDILLLIDKLLERAHISLSDIPFIAVNQGPAPFTALRVVITTANAIAYASQVPLVGVNGLAAFLEEYATPQWPLTVALLNAFGNEVYIGMHETVQTEEFACLAINEALIHLENKLPANAAVQFIGNGATMLQKDIMQLFAKAYFPESMPQYVSLNYLATYALRQWNEKVVTQHVLPLYLKKLHYKPSVS